MSNPLGSVQEKGEFLPSDAWSAPPLQNEAIKSACEYVLKEHNSRPSQLCRKRSQSEKQPG